MNLLCQRSSFFWWKKKTENFLTGFNSLEGEHTVGSDESHMRGGNCAFGQERVCWCQVPHSCFSRQRASTWGITPQEISVFPDVCSISFCVFLADSNAKPCLLLLHSFHLGSLEFAQSQKASAVSRLPHLMTRGSSLGCLCHHCDVSGYC